MVEWVKIEPDEEMKKELDGVSVVLGKEFYYGEVVTLNMHGTIERFKAYYVHRDGVLYYFNGDGKFETFSNVPVRTNIKAICKYSDVTNTWRVIRRE